MTSQQSLTANLVGHEPMSAAQVHETYRIQYEVETVSKALAAGHKAGVLDRKWEGNERFGHYVYTRKSRTPALDSIRRARHEGTTVNVIEVTES